MMHRVNNRYYSINAFEVDNSSFFWILCEEAGFFRIVVSLLFGQERFAGMRKDSAFLGFGKKPLDSRQPFLPQVL